MSEIPRPEIDTLILTCAEATDLALEGEVGDGYQALLAGLQRAREAALDREPWGEGLLTRWQRAVEEYAGQGVANPIRPNPNLKWIDYGINILLHHPNWGAPRRLASLTRGAVDVPAYTETHGNFQPTKLPGPPLRPERRRGRHLRGRAPEVDETSWSPSPGTSCAATRRSSPWTETCDRPAHLNHPGGSL